MTPENAPQDKHEKKPRHRSPNYPAIGLRSAVDKIKAIFKKDGLAPSLRDAALKHMGFDKFHGEAARILSALKSFGLIEETTERIKLTQRGIDIVARPEDDAQRAAALQGAATSPEVYRELLKQFQESGLPSDTALRSELIAVKKFNPNAVDSFIRDFRDSLDFAGLSDLAVLGLDVEGQEEIRLDTVELASTQVSQGPVRLPANAVGVPRQGATETLSRKAAEQIMQVRTRQDVFSLAEGPVTIQWPSALSPESIQDLNDWLDIVKRKISRSVKADDPVQ